MCVFQEVVKKEIILFCHFVFLDGWDVDREARAALLRVRIGPECPKGNLRALTRDSNPDCGISIV